MRCYESQLNDLKFHLSESCELHTQKRERIEKDLITI